MHGTSVTEELYQEYKPLLFSLAYRMLGSVNDAEDVVHETFLSLPAPASEAQPIRNMKAFLCKIATHRCIDRLRSAAKQREVYVGPWLPEPLVIGPDGENDPYRFLEQAESLSTAYLLLLQQLSWVERVVFLLREALQYEYDEIAEIVGKSGTNCRQIFHRAKRSIGQRSSPDSEAVTAPTLQEAESNEQFAGLINQFVSALASGDLGKLLSVLSEDATLLSDGGGKVSAAIRPILGADRISRFFVGLLKKEQPGFSFRMATVNGTPGIVTYAYSQPDSVISFRMDDNGRIASVYIVVNPDKLGNVR